MLPVGLAEEVAMSDKIAKATALALFRDREIGGRLAIRL
jgi:hypothetical protein